MIRDFVFRFGYCTPSQWAANDQHGWDDESSYAFVVQAESEELALKWDSEVANAFVAHLFETQRREQPMAWKDAHFAYWVEKHSEPSTEAKLPLPSVRFGEMPAFADWT